MLSEYQRKQTLSAIQDCDRFIEKEEARNAALRPLDVAELLDWYKRHRQSLINLLSWGSL